MSKYYCADCGKQIEKESFGYPVCCGSTMRRGPAPQNVRKEYKDLRVLKMAKELDDYVRNNQVTDWELDFIADMQKRWAFTPHSKYTS